MPIYLAMFTETHVSESAKLSSQASPPRYITNAKSIVHFAAATRPVFVGLPASGHTERCKLECTRNWMKCDIGSNVISASSRTKPAASRLICTRSLYRVVLFTAVDPSL